MKRFFEFNGEKMEIENGCGYGQYTLRGMGACVHCTDSSIWDWCDDEENEEKHNMAISNAYYLLKNSL